VSSRKLFTASVLVAASWLAVSGSLITGQETKKAKGRLPPYYADIVTPEQREKIYSIQAAYDTQKEKLEAQLDGLKDKESKEIESILTPQQKGKLKLAQDEAAAKKKKKADDKKAAEGEAAPDAKATTKAAPADAKKPSTEKKTK